jgi:putative membrane protein
MGFMLLGKAVVFYPLMALFWLAALVNLFSPVADPMGTVLLWGAPALLLMHTAEHFFFSRRFAAMGAPLSVKDRYMILIFGGFHLMSLMKKVPSQAGGEQHSA